MKRMIASTVILYLSAVPAIPVAAQTAQTPQTAPYPPMTPSMQMGMSAPAAPSAQAALPPEPLTLDQAHAIAAHNEPELLSAQYQAAAAKAITSEVRSAYFPQVFGELTGVDSQSDSRITAGALNNPIIYSRYANGIEADQLVTDFGRTHSRVASANLQAQSQQQTTQATLEDVLLNVDQAYYGALAAQAVLKVAQQDVSARQAVADQVSELAKNQLKSSLDVSFANVNLGQAQLFLTQAQNNYQAAQAQLSLALGESTQHNYILQEQPLPPAPTPDIDSLIAQAYQQRPELASSRLHVESAKENERAEAELWLPALSAVGVAGLTPVRNDDQLDDRYAAVGFNLSIPIYDHSYAARHAEASAEASAANEDLVQLQDQIAHDVRVAWLNANTAHDRLAITQQLLDEATLALQLAQARYTLGLSSIVELSEAELNQTQAEVDNAQANYTFEMAIDQLSFQLGTLR